MSNTRTPFDDEIERVEAAASEARAHAIELAKQAKQAARTAKKQEQNLKNLDRRLRDRARYIVGGLVVDDVVRNPQSTTEGYLKKRLSPADFALVEEVLQIERAKAERQKDEPPKSENAAP